MSSNDEISPLWAAVKAKVEFFSDIEHRDGGIVYTITEGVSTDLIVAVIEAAWGDDKNMRWRFSGDRLVYVYPAEEDKSDDKDSIKLVVRVSRNFDDRYDWFELTEDELEQHYSIYKGCLFKKSYLESNGIETGWMNGCDNPTPAELFNYELISSDEKETFEYCKKAYNYKYSYLKTRDEIVEEINDVKQTIKTN